MLEMSSRGKCPKEPSVPAPASLPPATAASESLSSNGELSVLPENEVENRSYVYEHSKESKYPGKYFGDSGQPAVKEQFDKACYQEIGVDDNNKRTDQPCQYSSLHNQDVKLDACSDIATEL
jgi:hypothetical protein